MQVCRVRWSFREKIRKLAEDRLKPSAMGTKGMKEGGKWKKGPHCGAFCFRIKQKSCPIFNLSWPLLREQGHISLTQSLLLSKPLFHGLRVRNNHSCVNRPRTGRHHSQKIHSSVACILSDSGDPVHNQKPLGPHLWTKFLAVQENKRKMIKL